MSLGKPGGTAQQFEADSRECLQESSPTPRLLIEPAIV